MNEKNQKMIRKLEQANFSEQQITIRHSRKNGSDFYAVIIHDPGISVFEIEELLAEYGEPQYNDISLCHFKRSKIIRVYRDHKHPVDISGILPDIKTALTELVKTEKYQTIQLPTRPYIIDLNDCGYPELRGPMPVLMNRETGKPISECDYLITFGYVKNVPDFVFDRTAKQIAKYILENELNVKYIQRQTGI